MSRNACPTGRSLCDEFGPLGIRPIAGIHWAEQSRPDRLPATYKRTHGITSPCRSTKTSCLPPTSL
jgi:hypothetical protein